MTVAINDVTLEEGNFQERSELRRIIYQISPMKNKLNIEEEETDEIKVSHVKFDHAMYTRYICQRKRNGNQEITVLWSHACNICGASLFTLCFFLLLSALLHHLQVIRQ